MNDTWYDMGFDADMSWMYDWKGKEKKMGISESKKEIVINNYFKRECDVNTSIKEAFTKGFELGLKKAPIPSVNDVLDKVTNKIQNLDADNMSGNYVKALSISFLLAEKK